MSEINWRDSLSTRCLYVYNDEIGILRAEDLKLNVDGVVEAISVPNPADQRGGNRFIVLLNNEDTKNHFKNHGIIYQGRKLNVEISSNTCDIPNEWQKFVNGSYQQPMQYPSGQQSAEENDVYTNVPGTQNIPMPSPQQYIGQPMAAPPGQQNPMNPGLYPFKLFYMQGIPVNIYPQEGAVGQILPPENGCLPCRYQLWMQHMQQIQKVQQMFPFLTLSEAYPLVLKNLMSKTIENPDTVAVVLEESNNELFITGYSQAVTDVSNQVADIIHKINAENGFTQGTDDSDLAMSQHHIECQTRACGSYSEFYCNACHQRMCGECRDLHLKHPDNTKHEVCKYEDRMLTVQSVPCKLHPRQQLTLCCKKCHHAICAICTTNEHDGHGSFLNLEEVYTKNYKTRIEEVRKIRDDVLPKSRVRLKESKDATLEAKENVEVLSNSMKEQAKRIKGLVDDILTKNLQELQRYEATTVEKLENQEKVMDSYVTQMQTLLERYKYSISSSNPIEFLPEMSNTPIVDLDPVPEVKKESPRNFLVGKLNKDEISKQFGKLT